VCVCVCQQIREMLPAVVHLGGVTSLPTRRNTCTGQGHDAGSALSVNVWTVKDRVRNTEIWKDIVELEITVNRTGWGQQCNVVIYRDEIK